MRLGPKNPMKNPLLSILVFEAIVFGLAIAGMIQVDNVPVPVAVTAASIGIVLAIAAHLSLIPVRYTPHITARQIRFRDIIDITRNDRHFAVFSLFFGIWSIGYYIAIPNLNVLMIRQLGLSYSTIAIYINCQLLMMLAGYSFFPRYIEKFGSKSVLKIILVPLAAVPLVWFFAEPSNHPILVPSMLLYGFAASGSILSANTYLFSILPKDNRAPAYMVFWSVIVFGSMALGPKLASVIMGLTRDFHMELGFLTIMNVKLTFLVVSASFFGSFLVLRRLRDQKPIPARVLVDQIFRRNPVAVAFNLFILNRAEEERISAYALEKLGKTRGVVAFDTLTGALDDISPLVRRQAASSIGDTRLPEGVGPLVDILNDPESDIRSEAAEALGKIGTPEARCAVENAFGDPDPSVRAAAVRSLGKFPGGDADERLLAIARTETHPLVFAAVADAVADRKTPAAAELILRGRELFTSPRIRSRILWSLARMFGAGDEYYALVAPGGTRSALRVRKYLESLSREVSRMKEHRDDDLAKEIGRLAEAYAAHETGIFLDSAERIAMMAEKSGCGGDIPAVARAIRTLVDIKREGRIPNLPGKAFIAVAAGVIAKHLVERVKNGRVKEEKTNAST